MNLLKVMLNKRMAKEKLSTRQVAKQVGVSHTTIARVAQGYQPDFRTLKALCSWLGVSPDAVVGMVGDENLEKRIASLLSQYPQLKEVFEKVVEKIEREEVEPHILEDVLGYISYRLGINR